MFGDEKGPKAKGINMLVARVMIRSTYAMHCRHMPTFLYAHSPGINRREKKQRNTFSASENAACVRIRVSFLFFQAKTRGAELSTTFSTTFLGVREGKTNQKRFSNYPNISKISDDSKKQILANFSNQYKSLIEIDFFHPLDKNSWRIFAKLIKI